MFSLSVMWKLALLALAAIAVFALSLTAGAQQLKNGITDPTDGATVTGTVVVKGYASDPSFAKWQLDFLPSGDPNAAIFLALGDTPGEFTVSEDLTRFANGKHALRLRVVRQNSNYDEFLTHFTLANTGSAPASAPSAASPEANKALVRQYVDQVLNARNPNAIDQLVAPNYKRYLTATAAPVDAAAQKKRLAANFAAFPDLHATLDDIIAEGDRVSYRMTIRGTHKGTLMGIPPTGKQVTVTAIEVARIQDGKYFEHWGGVDNLDLIQQLGVVITPK